MRKLYKYFIGRISNEDGNRGNDAGGTSTNGVENEQSDILVDNNGKVIVRLADNAGFIPVPFPVIIDYGSVTNSDFDSEDIEVEFLNAGPTQFFGVSGTNNSGSDMYFQIFNKGGVPVNNDVPIRSYIVPAGSNYSISPFIMPQTLINGLGIAWSTTPNILTLPGVDIGTAYLEWQG